MTEEDNVTDKPMSAAEARMLMERLKVERYLDARAELKKAEEKMGFLKAFKHFPYVNQWIGMGVAALMLLMFLYFLPTIGDYFAVKWNEYGMGGRNLFLASLGVNMLLILLLAVILLFARSVVGTWVKSGITKKPILQLHTKNRTGDFIIPKEVDLDVWTVNDNCAIVPDPDAIIIGPHNRPMMLGVPEIGFGLNLRHLIEGHDIGIDMTVIKQYGEKHELKMWNAMKSGMDSIKPLMPWLVIMLVMGAIFGPFFWGKIGDMEEGKKWRLQYESCRVDMLDKGMKPASETTAAPPTTIPAGGDAPAFMGISIK